MGRFNLINSVLNISAERYFRTAGDLFIYEGNYESALEMIEKTLEIDETNVKALVLKGDILFCLNDDLEALKSLNKAIDLDSGCAEAYISKAGVLDVLGKYRRALDNCDLALAKITAHIDYLLPTLCEQKIALLIRLRKYRQAQCFLKQCRTLLSSEDYEELSFGHQQWLDKQCRHRQNNETKTRRSHLKLLSSPANM